MESVHTSFRKLIECYIDLSFLFVKVFSPGPLLLREQDRLIGPREIPPSLQADYYLLQLPAEASLTEVRTQYRQLAKRFHPDTGGQHADFLALQQAYERVVGYLQTGDHKRT